MSNTSYCIPGCSGTSRGILTRGIYTLPPRSSRDIPGHPSQLLYIQTIPCPTHPTVSQDVPGHSRTSQQVIHTHADLARTSEDIPGHPSQLLYITNSLHTSVIRHILLCSKQPHVQYILLYPRMFWDIPGHPNKRYIYTPT